VPFTVDRSEPFAYADGDWIYIKGIREAILSGQETVTGRVITADGVRDITLTCAGLSKDERLILTEGCLMNYYAAGFGKD
jgi:aconitate hydratase